MNPKNKARNQPIPEWCGHSHAQLIAEERKDQRAARRFARQLQGISVRGTLQRNARSKQELPF